MSVTYPKVIQKATRLFWHLTPGLSCCRKPERGTSVGWKQSAPGPCSAQSLTLLWIGPPRRWSTRRALLEPEDGSECPCHLFHIGVIDVAKHADDTAFINHPNLLAEDHRIVG